MLKCACTECGARARVKVNAQPNGCMVNTIPEQRWWQNGNVHCNTTYHLIVCVLILGMLFVNVVKRSIVWWTKSHFYYAISVNLHCESHEPNEQNCNGIEHIAMDFIHWCNVQCIHTTQEKGYNITKKKSLYLSLSLWIEHQTKKHRKKIRCIFLRTLNFKFQKNCYSLEMVRIFGIIGFIVDFHFPEPESKSNQSEIVSFKCLCHFQNVFECSHWHTLYFITEPHIYSYAIWIWNREPKGFGSGTESRKIWKLWMQTDA